MISHFIKGTVDAHNQTVPRVSTELVLKDYLGTLMVRWGINRGNYRINPGLYAVGTPDSSSDVFVTANYKLSFDTLRKNLAGLNSWILILDTKGINVWCAAGKGTFSTEELIKKIQATSLPHVISHKRIIVPQLGATGVAAYKVKEATGLNIHFGPVNAADIKRFISAGYIATREMRKVTFNFIDRIKLIPNDFIYGRYYFLAALAVILAISAFNNMKISLSNLEENWFHSTVNIFVAYFSGIVITPMLLPWIPGRRFSLKGFFVGILSSLIMYKAGFLGDTVLMISSWTLIISAVSSFLAMNFTGSSTYTSLSGVKKEMKSALPLQIILSAVGIILLIVSKFIL